MIGWTLCSGIGAPEIAAPWVDWRLASEIENFPRAVLQDRFGYRLPEDHNQGEPLLWSDMTQVTPELARSKGVPLPDLLVAGTPCQAFSIAGLRNGVGDERGNLTLKFVETCRAIVDAQPSGKLAVLWENVPGVLSDKGNAFGCFLAGLVGSDDALSAPDGGSWPSVGMVSGPRSRAAWRVLDAQYFGVAQRRRRVFVVVDFGRGVDPAAVLFERQGLRGNTPPRRETREGVAGRIAKSLAIRGRDGTPQVEVGDEVANAILTPNGGRGGIGCGAVLTSTGDVSNCLNAGLMCADIAPTLNAHFGDKMGLENQHINSGCGMFVTETAGTMKAMQGSGGWSNSADHAAAGYMVPVALPFDLNQITSKANRSQPDPEVCHTIPAASCAPHLATPWAVRRLMPVECERLQGFPDDHCAITYRGKPAADGPKYQALGNSMAVPVIAWLMDRMKISMEAAQ